MKKTLFAALSIVAMTSCNKSLIEAPALESEYGYINLGISSNSDLVVTKGDGIDTSTYLVTLWRSNEENGTYTALTGYPKMFKQISDDDNSVTGTQLKVESGWYKISVENNSSTTIYEASSKGEKHLSAESSPVQVTAGGTAPLSAECHVINTAVSVKPTAHFTNTFINEKVTVTVGDRTWTYVNVTDDQNTTPATESSITFETNDQVFFPANTERNSSYYADLSIVISASTASTPNKTYTLTRSSQRAHWSQITLDAGQNGSITITITAVDDMSKTPVTETITLDPLSTGTVNNQ